MEMVVGTVKGGITKGFKKIMAKCQEGNGYGITIKDDNYVLEDIPVGYHQSTLDEIEIWRYKYAESLYDNYDLDDYEADRIVDRVNLVESCISFTKYNSSPKIQEGYDLFVKSVSVAYEPFYLVFNLKENLLCLWGPNMSEW